jgi:hypothetical protein
MKSAHPSSIVVPDSLCCSPAAVHTAQHAIDQQRSLRGRTRWKHLQTCALKLSDDDANFWWVIWVALNDCRTQCAFALACATVDAHLGRDLRNALSRDAEGARAMVR